jgi:hypothetical protein
VDLRRDVDEQLGSLRRAVKQMGRAEIDKADSSGKP